MEEFNDRISIHIANPISKSRSHSRVYNYAYHILKTNTPTPKNSYSSSITSYINPSTTHTIPRMSHRILKQNNLNTSRYKA